MKTLFQVSYWVAWEILQEKTARLRADKIAYFVKVAKVCSHGNTVLFYFYIVTQLLSISIIFLIVYV